MLMTYHSPGQRPVFAAYAGFVSRMIAMIVDLLVIATLWIVGGLSMAFMRETSGIAQISKLLEHWLNWITPLAQFLLGAVFEAIILLSLSFSYFAFFYAFGGVTLGKYLMGLRVVRTNGTRLSFVQAMMRTFAYAASSLPLYMGFLSVLFDDQRRAWHDRLVGTVVVYDWDARADENFLRARIEWLNRR